MIARTIRKEAKRDQIRAAARDLFLRQGFAETSMDAVTSAAGVSKQTLYRYYETKAELFADVLTRLVAEAGPPAPRSPEPRPPKTAADLEAALVAVAESYLGRLMRPQQLALLRVVIAEGSRVPELTEAFRSTIPAGDAATVMAVIEGGRDAGLVPASLDSRAAARALASLMLAFVFRDGLLAPSPRPPDRRQLAKMVHLLVSGIAARPGAPAGGEAPAGRVG